MKSLHLATPEDLPKLIPMVRGLHDEMGYGTTPDQQQTAMRPLLDGSPHGAIWLIGPRRSPVGYLAISFGWSLEHGGLDATVDELYVRPAVRRRGMGHDALDDIAKALKDAGVRALHMEVNAEDPRAQTFTSRTRFKPRDRAQRLSRVL